MNKKRSVVIQASPHTSVQGSTRMSRLLLLPTTTTGGGGRATGKRPSAARLSRIVTSSATDPVQICTQAAKLAERVQQRIEPIFADTYLAQSDVLPVQVRDDWRLLQREAVTIAFSAIKGNLSACRGTVSVLINDPLSEQGDEVVELGKDDAEVITEEKDAGIRDRIVEIEQQTVGMVDELQKLCRKIRPSVDLLVELSQAQQTNLGELRIVISCMKAKDVPIIDAAVREIMHVKKDESFQSLESVRFLAKYCSSDLRIKYEKEHLNYVLRSDKPWLIYSLYRGLLTRSANPLLTALKYHLVFLEIKRNTGNEEYGRFANSFVSYAHEMLDSCGSPQVALYLMTKTCKKDPTSRKTSSGKPDTISEESKNDKKKGTNRIKSLLGFSEIQKKFSSDGNLEDEFRVSALDYALEKNVAMFFHNPLVQKIFDELWVSSDFMGSTKAQSESSVKDSLKIGSIAARWEDILRFMKNLQTYLVNYLAVPRQKYFFRFASFFFIICALYLHLITLDPTTELSFNFLDLFLIVSAASLVTQQIRDIQEEGMYYHFKSSENLFDLLLTACLVSFLIIRLFFSVTFVDTDSITLALYLFFGCLVSIAASFRLIQGLKVLRDFGPLIRIIFKMTTDILNFLALIAIIILGFTISFKFLLKPVVVPGFETSNDAAYSLFLGLAGTFDPGAFDSYPSLGIARFSRIFLLIFVIVSLIVLSNLLVAMMSSTFEKVEKQSNIEFEFLRAKEVRESFKSAFLLPPPLTFFVVLSYYLGKLYLLITETYNGVKDKYSLLLLFSGDPPLNSSEDWVCGFCYKIMESQKNSKKLHFAHFLSTYKSHSNLRSMCRVPLKVLGNNLEMCEKCLLPKSFCKTELKYRIQANISSGVLVFVLFVIALAFSFVPLFVYLIKLGVRKVAHRSGRVLSENTSGSLRRKNPFSRSIEHFEELLKGSTWLQKKSRQPEDLISEDAKSEEQLISEINTEYIREKHSRKLLVEPWMKVSQVEVLNILQGLSDIRESLNDPTLI